MNIFTHLKSEHDKFRKTANEIHDTTDRAEVTRNEKYAELRRGIITHHEAEEVVLVPALKNHKETKDMGMEIVEEHHVLEYIISELDKLDVTDETWGVKFGVFKEILEHHLKEEEEEIANEAQKILGKEKLEELNEEYEKEHEVQKEKYDKKQNK